MIALISELEHELSLIGQTPTAQRIANEVRRLGSKATKEQREEIERLITQIDHETEALRKREEAQRAQTQAIDSLFQMGQDAFSSMVSGSERASEAVKKLALQIALAAAQAALLGTGPLAGLFGGGGLFGGSAAAVDPWAGLRNVGFSSGTANTGGQRGQPRGIVHGQEAVIPLPNGGKVPVQMQGSSASGGGETRVTVDVGVSVDDTGKLQAYVRNVSQEATRAGIREYDRGTNARVVSAVREASRRNVKF